MRRPLVCCDSTCPGPGRGREKGGSKQAKEEEGMGGQQKPVGWLAAAGLCLLTLRLEPACVHDGGAPMPTLGHSSWG